MTTETFWQLIDESREAAGGVPARQEGELAELLSLLPPAEIVAFQAHLDLAMLRAYRSELWAAACILGGGCSDDSFLDFRACLIARGRLFFEAVVDDPEALVSLGALTTTDETLFYEGLQYVPANVYEAQTDREMPPTIISGYAELEGPPWDESEESLEALLPRLYRAVRDR